MLELKTNKANPLAQMALLSGHVGLNNHTIGNSAMFTEMFGYFRIAVLYHR